MKPPRLARTLLIRALPSDASGRSVIGDFDDEFALLVARHGAGAARRWYWREAVGMWWWSAWRHPVNSYHQPRGDALTGLIGDIRTAVRVSTQSPGQTLLVVMTLALAIGATTIGFAFADTVILRGMPIADPYKSVIVFGVDARDPDRRTGVYFGDYLEIRDRSRTVEDLSAWSQTRVTLRRGGTDPERVTVNRVTGDLFGVWGLRMQLGRALDGSDTTPGAPPVAVLTDRAWTNMFARAHSAMGQSVLIDDVPHTIVGVLTPDAEFGTFANIAMWVAYPVERRETRRLDMAVVAGRLAENATVEQAVAELQAIAASLEQQYPATNDGRQVLVIPASRAVGGPNLWLVMTLLIGTAGLVTVIAAVNVAGVLLSRAVLRQREFALRAALGAGRRRLFRQLLVEGMLLAICAGIGGLLLTDAGLRFIRSVDAEPVLQQIWLDGHEVLFVTVLSVLTPLVFSLAPAVTALRVDLVSTLNASSSRTIGGGRRSREVLVVSQLALAAALAIVGGLIARTANAQFTATNGFNPDNVATFVMSFENRADAAGRRQLVRTLSERLREHGIVAAGAIEMLPAVASEPATGIAVNGEAMQGDAVDAWAHVVAIDAHALETLGVTLLSGRPFTDNDVNSEARVALVSVEAARRYFSNGDVIGRRIDLRRGDAVVSYQVVGVTGNVRNADPERGMPPRVWLPLSDPKVVTFLARHGGDLAWVSRAIRTAARSAAPDIPVESLESYRQAIGRRQGSDRVAIGMLLSFASLAIVFAAIGLYGTVVLTATLRRAEFATRYALGARVRDVSGLVLGQAFKLLVIGLVPGITLGLLAALGMQRLLFGVTPLDPLNLVGAVALLVAITVVASVGPAWRAARVSVMESLRAS